MSVVLLSLSLLLQDAQCKMYTFVGKTRQIRFLPLNMKKKKMFILYSIYLGIIVL